MFEFDSRKERFASPINKDAGKTFVSPELNYDSYRIMSEGRASNEKQEIEHVSSFGKPKSALSGVKNSRYFSVQRVTAKKHDSSSSRLGFRSYFKDAAELLTSRISKQIRKYFNVLKNYSEGKLLFNSA